MAPRPPIPSLGSGADLSDGIGAAEVSGGGRGADVGGSVTCGLYLSKQAGQLPWFSQCVSCVQNMVWLEDLFNERYFQKI